MLVFKEVGGIEMVVAEEFPYVAMKFVGAGLDGGVENGGAGAAKLGAEVRGLDLEFFNSVDRRKNDEVRAVEEVNGVRVVINAVQQVIVLRSAKPIGREGAAGGVAARVSLRSVDASRKLGQEGKIPAVQGKIVDALRIDDLPHGSVLGLEHGSGGGDFNGCRHIAGFEREIRDDVLTDVDLDMGSA